MRTVRQTLEDYIQAENSPGRHEIRAYEEYKTKVSAVSTYTVSVASTAATNGKLVD